MTAQILDIMATGAALREIEQAAKRMADQIERHMREAA